MEDKLDKSTKDKPVKKTYAPPVLQEWGTLKDITLASGNGGKADHGKAPYKWTS